MGNFIEGVAPEIVYSKATGNVFQTVNKKSIRPVPVPTQKSFENSELIPWGVDNIFPQRILKEIRKSTIIAPTLKKQAEIAYDQIVYGLEESTDGSEPKFKRAYDPQVEAFFNRSQIHRYAIESLRNFYHFYFATPRLIFTKDRSQVYSISCYKTAHFRFARPDDFGYISKGYICADWESYYHPTSEYVRPVPLIDIYQTPEFYREEQKDFEYIYPLAYPTEDEIHYPLVDWNTARESGWLEVAQSIPKFKKALMKNQVALKNLIQIPSWWWEWKHPGFDKMDEKKRKDLVNLEADKFEKFFKGEDNAGNSMLVTYISDPKYQKEYQGWKVEAVDNKIKDGIYIEDSNEAASHLLFALGMDPAIIGIQPGSKMGAGSGSDKRVAFNIYVDTVKAHQDLILEPLSWIAAYNGWPPYKFKFKNALQTNETTAPAPSRSGLVEPNQQAN